MFHRDVTDDWRVIEFGEVDLVDLRLASRGEPTTIVLPGTAGAYLVSCARR